MSRSYRKIGAGRAHYRAFGANVMKRDDHKQTRRKVKAMKDEEGTPILPSPEGIVKRYNFPRKFKYFRENIIQPDDFKIPFIGRKLERIRKYALSREDVNFIYRMKSK